MGRLSNFEKSRMPPPPGPEERYRQDVLRSINRQVALLIRFGMSIEDVQAIRAGDNDLIKVLAYNLRDRSYKGRRLGKDDVDDIAKQMVNEFRYLESLRNTVVCKEDA